MTRPGAYAGLSLEGRVALVTGSARGIGAALAVGLAQAGADVAVSDLPAMLEDAATTQNRVEDLGRRSVTYPLDVLDLGNIRTAVDQVVKDFGRPGRAGEQRRNPETQAGIRSNGRWIGTPSSTPT